MVESRQKKRAGSTSAEIDIQGLRKAFGTFVAVNDVSIRVQAGEFLALLGPSGSGKSTILMSIAGFERPTGGRILIDGVDCTRIAPHQRNIGMVFQNYTLFPHLSVVDNVAFPLKMRGEGRVARRVKAQEALQRVHLSDYGARMPNQLSGGQQQRVALARAIVYRPRVLLMDEPFSALDKKLREEMRLEAKRLHADLGITVVFVTHDQEEALTMADRVAVLKDGQVQQIGPARELYEHPKNLFVAGFIGSMNFIPATLAGQRLGLPDGSEWTIEKSSLVGEVTDGPATVAIRPERMAIAERPGDLKLSARIRDVVYSGADTIVIAVLPDGNELQVRTNSAEEHLDGRSVGDEIGIYCRRNTPLVYAGRPE